MYDRFRDHLAQQLTGIRTAGLYKSERVITTPQDARIEVAGGQRPVLNLCANNYLGLAEHPDVIRAAHEALDRWGYGMASVRFICGTQHVHKELERRLSEFLGTDDTILYSSCFDANGGLFETLLDEQDAVISDALNHASIIDGVRLCKAQRLRYRHADMDDLRAQLVAAKSARTRLIATDGVFSMDGDIAPLPELYEVAKKYDILFMVDDAHGEGVLGKGGRGIVDHFGLHGKVDIEVGTMSKAFGVVGGMVAGDRLIVEWLRQRGRPFLFSSAVTAPDAAACLAAVDLLEESTELVDKLWANAKYFKTEMKKLGFDTGLSETPITPVMLGEAPLAQQFSRDLFEEGVFAMAIGYPTVAKGKARIRVMISAAHDNDDLGKGLEAFEKVGKKLGVVSSAGH